MIFSLDMSFLNCQLKWGFAFHVLMREHNIFKLLTPEHLEIQSIIVGIDKYAPRDLDSCGYQDLLNINHSSKTKYLKHFSIL